MGCYLAISPHMDLAKSDCKLHAESKALEHARAIHVQGRLAPPKATLYHHAERSDDVALSASPMWRETLSTQGSSAPMISASPETWGIVSGSRNPVASILNVANHCLRNPG